MDIWCTLAVWEATTYVTDMWETSGKDDYHTHLYKYLYVAGIIMISEINHTPSSLLLWQCPSSCNVPAAAAFLNQSSVRWSFFAQLYGSFSTPWFFPPHRLVLKCWAVWVFKWVLSTLHIDKNLVTKRVFCSESSTTIQRSLGTCISVWQSLVKSAFCVHRA